MADLSVKELLDAHMTALRISLEEVKELQRSTNGRVRTAEVKIAVLQAGYALGTFLAAAWFFEWIKR